MSYPGYGSTVTNTPTAILASSYGYIVINVTIKSGEGEVAKGTILGIETSSEKYVKYVNGGSGGEEVAKAIIADEVDATSGDQLVAAYIRGAFVVSKLTGVGASTVGDLNARLIGKVGGGTNDILLV